MGLVEGDAADIALGELLKQASVAMKLRRPQRLLNFLGEDDGSCALITDPRRLEKMRVVAQLAAAINDYKSTLTAAKEKKAAEKQLKADSKAAMLAQEAGIRRLLAGVAIEWDESKKVTGKVLKEYCGKAGIHRVGAKAVGSCKAAELIQHFMRIATDSVAAAAAPAAAPGVGDGAAAAAGPTPNADQEPAPAPVPALAPAEEAPATVPAPATAAATADGLIGVWIKKEFEGHGVFVGEVVSYDTTEGYYKVRYQDGDEEELSGADVRALECPRPEALCLHRPSDDKTTRARRRGGISARHG